MNNTLSNTRHSQAENSTRNPAGIRYPHVALQQNRVDTMSRPLTSRRTDLHRTTPTNPGVSERDTLYAEFAPLIRRLINQYGGTPELRNDLSGEIYCRFCALLDEYDPARGVPLKPYLVRQLTAAIYTYARKQWSIQRRETALEVENGGPDFLLPTFDPTPGWDTDLERKQVASTLPAAIMKLPERQQKVVVWRYYEDRSFEEIAKLLGIEPSTARSLLRHGLNKLRQQMQPATDATA